ncbi:MAG TPA: amidohydrolase family protein [Terriglobales bacterium]|nr:amidohydrolase family protein [Terriglobales bacterium]
MRNYLPNRRSFLKVANLIGLSWLSAPAALSSSSEGDQPHHTTPSTGRPDASPNTILLKDYRPISIYKVPTTKVEKAKFPVIDMHSHPYAKTPQGIDQWVKNMDQAGIEKTIILTMTTGKEFDEISRKYSAHGDRYEMWCGLDFTAYNTPGFAASAIKEMQRCRDAGARGVGEIHDKGQGLRSGKLSAPGMHPDDSRMDEVWDKCGELGFPVSIHVADPIWMYQKMDIHNDGLMNAYNWRLDNQPNIVKLSGMVDILERTVQKHPKTTFIACHFANLSYDLARLGRLLENNPNLHADISARYAETSTIPRFTSQFYSEHADRLVYGTDMGFDSMMYAITFRILESLDEHFYENDQFGYHWALNGLGLPDTILEKVYHENAAKLLAARGA